MAAGKKKNEISAEWKFINNVYSLSYFPLEVKRKFPCNPIENREKAAVFLVIIAKKKLYIQVIF